MIDFDVWWNSAAADEFRATHEDMEGSEVRPIWIAAVLATLAHTKKTLGRANTSSQQAEPGPVQAALLEMESCFEDPMWADHAEVSKNLIRKWHRVFTVQQQAEPTVEDRKRFDETTAWLLKEQSGFAAEVAKIGKQAELEDWSTPERAYPANLQLKAEPGADERAAFEAWALKTSDGNCCEEDLQRWGSDDGDLAGQYVNALVERDWLVWQARAAQSGQRAGERECRHCGWMCRPNDAPTKKWHPLEQEGQRAGVAEGWKLVPTKPTDKMIAAFSEAFKQGSIWTDRVTHAFEAAIAATPTQQQEGGS